MRRALYIGSFDPLTNGHLWVIELGAKMFDYLVVAVGVNPKKTYTFSDSERVEHIERTTAHLKNVRVEYLGLNMTADFAVANRCNFLLQGIRDAADYEGQKAARYKNADFAPGLETVLVIPPRELVEVSSSFVKGLIGFNGAEERIKEMVPSVIFDAIVKRFPKEKK